MAQLTSLPHILSNKWNLMLVSFIYKGDVASVLNCVPMAQTW